ncbi:MAG: N-acetyl-gamma-glutamyl-phosphate reductase [Phycisphaerae bacterium]|nr:N-acetyl-gamma-glutamyl-phosphate reductase [Phycisphaerae bacterium]
MHEPGCDAEPRLKKRVVIVGAGGYGGAEALDLLLGHPGAEVVGLYGSSSRGSGERAPVIEEVFTRFRGRCALPVEAADVGSITRLAPDAAFLATPHEASHELAPVLADSGVVVFDLSAAFRLQDATLYPEHYGFEHRRGDVLARAPYGLCELFRDRIPGAKVIAVPGCYPTSAILALAPLVRAGALRPGHRPIIDAVSGVSGAGRSPAVKSLFCEVSLQPYNVLRHRHRPEIDAYAGVATIFTPHLGPYDRGILSTIHVELESGWTQASVRGVYAGAYANEPFIRLLPSGSWPAVADVRGTNYCDLAWAVDDQGHAIVVSAIDNLVKGAAGQAVQCFNIRFGFSETTGLLHGERVTGVSAAVTGAGR